MLESGNWMVGMDRAQELPAMATLLMTICAVHGHEASPAWDWAMWDSRRGRLAYLRQREFKPRLQMIRFL